MRDILNKVTKWWEAGETFGLATVVRTFRSAPRDPGAALAVSPDGEVVGSVSGGCVEGAVYELSMDVSQTGNPVLATYGVSDDDAFAVGLTCGGILDIFVERVNQAQFPELGDIAAAVERGEPVAVATVIGGPGQVGARRVIWGRDGSYLTGPAGPDRYPQVRRARRAPRGRSQRLRELVRSAAADARLRRNRLRGRRRAGREVPRLPRHGVRRPAGIRDQVALPRRGRG